MTKKKRHTKNGMFVGHRTKKSFRVFSKEEARILLSILVAENNLKQ